MKHRHLITILLLLFGVVVQAKIDYTEEEMQVMQRYYEMFNQANKEREFYELNKQVKDIMLKKNDRLGYYTFSINEITYEINMHRNSKALKLARKVLEEMKENGDGYFDMIYNTMGTIYEDRGNYKMAKYYNQKAIDLVNPKDTTRLIGAYLGMANLEASVHPDKAIELINRTLSLCKDYPTHYSYAQTMKGLACFFKNDPELFFETLDQYHIFKTEHELQDERNDTIMATVKAVFENKFNDALRLMNNKSYYSENLGYFDMLIQVYRLMGDKDMVIAQQQKKLNAIDSLNANLIYENMNEMNAEMEVNKTQRDAARARQYWLAAVILLLLIAGALLVWRYLTRRRFQKQLLQQNKELEIALLRAEESDRMKTSFIEHVSHEIRTPLNVVTGYAQIITNPDYELEEEERNLMLNDIRRNTMEITDIVNELLEVAQDESKEYYPKENKIAVNDFCRQMMVQAELKNNGRLKMEFRTDLSDDFVFMSNDTALKKVLDQLLSNAIKFTEEGSVTLYVHQSPDHGVVRFIVADTGIGISEEHQDQVFERFYKVNAFKQGFGLGLTMSRKIAILLGGSLELDKTYTQGARFILTLSTTTA